MNEVRRWFALGSDGITELEVRDEPTGCMVKNCTNMGGLFVIYKGDTVGLCCAAHRKVLRNAGARVSGRL